MAMGGCCDSLSPHSYAYLFTLNLFTCGIELCTSAAFSYLPPMLLETGFSETSMSIIMAMGPLLALLVLPRFGTASDQCTSRYGRRRPFILFFSVCVFLSLILLPNGMALGELLSGGGTGVLPARPSGLALVALSVILLDFGSQMGFLPIESLLSDQSKTDGELNKAYSVFNLMLSLGSCFGYLVMCIDWDRTFLSEALGGQEHTLFAILLLLFVIMALPSLLFAKDPPLTPQDLKAPDLPPVLSLLNGSAPTGSQSSSGDALLHREQDLLPATSHPSSVVLKIPAILTFRTPGPQHYLLRGAYRLLSFPAGCLCSCLACLLPQYVTSYASETLNNLTTMPAVIRKLCLVNLVTCMAVMGFKLYFTDYVGEALYHGNPDSPIGSPARHLYENGIRMASLGLLFQSITSAMFSFVLNYMIMVYGPVSTYLFGMVTFTVVTGLMLVIKDVLLTVMLASFTGFASAVTNSLPFTLLTVYLQKQEMYFTESEKQEYHLRGIGSNLAILDGAYVLSEVLSSFFFGIAVEISATTSTYIFCSSVCGIVSCYYILQLR